MTVIDRLGAATGDLAAALTAHAAWMHEVLADSEGAARAREEEQWSAGWRAGHASGLGDVADQVAALRARAESAEDAVVHAERTVDAVGQMLLASKVTAAELAERLETAERDAETVAELVRAMQAALDAAESDQHGEAADVLGRVRRRVATMRGDLAQVAPQAHKKGCWRWHPSCALALIEEEIA